MHRFARRTLFVLCLMAGLGGPPAAQGQQVPDGNVAVSLGVPAGYDLQTTSILIENRSNGFSGTFNFGGGSGPFMIIQVPAGNGYSATAFSTPVGNGACSGINPDFPVFAGAQTGVYLSLACQRLPPPQGPNGNMNLHLNVPVPWMGVDATSLQIRNPSNGYSGTVDFGGGSGPFAVNHLPAGSGYIAEVYATPVGGGGTCYGTNQDFPIFDQATTIVFMRLNCARPPGVPALGRYVPLLAAALALVGTLAVRTRRRRKPVF